MIAEVKNLSAISLYLYISSRFKNGVVYNYSHKKSASLLGVSRYTLHKYIPLLIEKGWLFMHNGNLCKRSWYKADKSLSYDKSSRCLVIDIKPGYGLSDIKAALSAHILEYHAKRQQYRINQKTELKILQAKIQSNRHVTKGQRDYFNKNEHKLKEKVFDQVLFSVRGVSELLKTSVTTAHRLLKKAQELGIILMQEVKEVVYQGHNARLNAEHGGYEGYVYANKYGQVVRHRGQSFVFLG